MITISARGFRANQKSILDMAARGHEILITRKNEAFTLSRVKEDDTLVNKKEFYEHIEKAISDIRSGKGYSMKPDESLDAFLGRMEAEDNV